MKIPFQRAVVTGGAGFIGSHVVDALVEAGVAVLVIDDFSTGQRENLSAHTAQGGAELLEVHDADICSESAYDAVCRWQPEAIFHFAAQINVRKSVDDPQFDATANVVGTVNMLQAAAAAGVQRFVFASTGGAIYGEQDYFPADEEHPIRPKCPYGVSKRAAEQYLAYYGAYSGLTTVSLRLANVYGPRQNPKGEAGVVAIFTDRLLRGEQLTVNGDGTQTRDFVFVGDVVQAALLVAQHQALEGFTVFNVGRGIEISVNEVVEVLSKAWQQHGAHTGTAMTVANGPALQGEQMRSVISPEKIKGAFSWSPRVEFSEGLAVTVQSFLSG